jgi:hypothetical protein
MDFMVTGYEIVYKNCLEILIKLEQLSTNNTFTK